MRRVRITKRFVDGLPTTGAEYFAWDAELKGFGVRIQASGAKSYVFKYSAGTGRGAPTRRMTLARIGKVTPEEARGLAKREAGKVAHGADPAAAKADERKAETLNELAALFLSEHVEAKRKASTMEQYRHVLTRFVLPELGSRKVAKVTPADIAKLHRTAHAPADDAKTPKPANGKEKWEPKNRPYKANRVLAVVSSLYSFAAKRQIVPPGLNPARGLERYREERRERFLTTDELTRLGDAIREGETVGLPYAVDEAKPKAKHAPKEENRRTPIGPHAAAAMRLLILTGARLREILHLRWDHVDFERGMLLLPDSKTGKKAIVLNAPAFDVLANLPRFGAHVIAGHSAGTAEEPPEARSKTTLAGCGEAGGARRRSHPRPAACARERRRGRRARAANHRQVARARSGEHDGPLRAP
jgi:integrase